MAWLDRGFKQRIVGAVVLVAFGVAFIPMLLTREDERREVRVEAPPMPAAPSSVPPELEPVDVPEPAPSDAEVAVQAQELIAVAEPSALEPETSKDSAPSPSPAPVTPAAKPVAEPSASLADSGRTQRVDENTLPVSWSIQLASLSNRANAEALVNKLRSQGYNGYVRQLDGMNRVFVGPLIERSEAQRLRDQLQRQQKLNGFVVRFQPERQ